MYIITIPLKFRGSVLMARLPKAAEDRLRDQRVFRTKRRAGHDYWFVTSQVLVQKFKQKVRTVERLKFDREMVTCSGEVHDKGGLSVVFFAWGQKVYEARRFEGWIPRQATMFPNVKPYSPCKETADRLVSIITSHRLHAKV